MHEHPLPSLTPPPSIDGDAAPGDTDVQENEDTRPEPVDYVPSPEIVVPAGKKARAAANIAAIKVLRTLEADERYATADEQDILAQWSGWGAVPEVFDPRRDDFATERTELEALLTSEEWNRSRTTILNAHYTDPAVVAETWGLLRRAGFAGGLVLEPGSGSGTFVGHAPSDAQMVGVELDSLTAQISAALYPSAQIRNESFADTAIHDNAFSATVGNVPFGDIKLWDNAHNQAHHSIHNHFILKSLDLTAPGGYVALLTSRFTADAVNPAARQAMADKADIVGAVRLPSGSFRRVAGTDVVTDLLVFRVRDQGQPPTPETRAFTRTVSLNVDAGRSTGETSFVKLDVNEYFADHPSHILGTLGAGSGMYGQNEMLVHADRSRPLGEQISATLGPVIDSAVASGLGHAPNTIEAVDDATLIDGRGLVVPVQDQAEIAAGTLRYNADGKQIDRFDGQDWVDAGCPKARVPEWRAIIDLRDTALSLIQIQRDGGDVDTKMRLRSVLNERYDAYLARYGFLNRFRVQEQAAVTQDQHDKKLADSLARWLAKEGADQGITSAADVPELVYDQLDEQAWKPRAAARLQAHLKGAIKDDPYLQTVLSLEHFDESRMIGSKAAIFTTDVLEPATPITAATDIHDALAVSMDESATVETARIAELLSTDVADIEKQLEENRLAFRSIDDPSVWIPRSRYLAGNVRIKLKDAEERAELDGRYRANASALRAVIPARIEEGINARLGVTWISPEDYEQFMVDTFGVDKDAVSVSRVDDAWVIENVGAYRDYQSDALSYGLVPKRWVNSTTYNFVGSEYEQTLPNQGVSLGRDRSGVVDHWQILEMMMNSKPIVINRSKEYKDAVPGSDLHAAATRAAKQRSERLQDAFTSWALNGDPDRRERLITEYNWRFNATVAPSYDGSHRSFPGLGTTYAPYAYQRNAVERIVNEPSVLLNHVVGAGKTGTMLMGAMELKRLGLVKQPWIVVPNHIVDQVSREAAQWYPAARILSGAGRTDAQERQKLLAHSASQDWDMVIVPMSAFTRMKTSAETRASFMEDQVQTLMATLLETKAEGQSRSIKQIQTALLQAQTRYEKALDASGKDAGLTFEQSGADYLFIDEAHLYKNLARNSSIQELSHPGSDQAMDLKLKLDYLRDRKRQEAEAAGVPADAYVERVATFATGTPVANSLAELFVMQSYLRPDMLEHAEVATIDAWGTNFTETVESVELNAAGTQLRSVTRVGQFANVGDLVGMVAQFSDVVTRDDVPANLPTLRTGRNIVVDFEPGQEVKDFIQDLGHRADTFDPRRMDIDNSLKVANDGRNVSLDPRCAHLDAPAEGGRVREVAERILTEWRTARDTTYYDQNGDPEPVTGGLQIVFCDRSVPKKDGSWSIYAGIKEELVAGGMPAEQIAFIHDFPKPQEKAALFQACRTGRISVLMGSTEKMGTGTNVQARAIALHHVDVPWRPADLEQREGRVIRQGNQNPEVAIYNYVATATYDTAMWQTLDRKAAFLAQLYAADRSIRKIEDLSADDLAESTALVKAIATGDPRYLRKVELERDIEDLESKKASHEAELRSRREEIGTLTRRLPNDEKRVETLAAAAPGLSAWAERDDRQYTVGSVTHTVRKEASAQLLEHLREAYVQLRGAGPDESAQVAELAGVPLHVTRIMEHDMVLLRFGDLPMAGLSITQEQLWAPANTATPGLMAGSGLTDADVQASAATANKAAMANGVMTRIENAIARAPDEAERSRQDLDDNRARLEELHRTPDEPFADKAKLQLMKTELASIQDALAAYEQSDAAQQAARELHERLAAKGRTETWSLMLNPTPAFVEELGFDSADEVRQMMRHREIEALEAFGSRHNSTWGADTTSSPDSTESNPFLGSYLEHRDQSPDTDSSNGWNPSSGPADDPDPDTGPQP